MNIPDPLYPCHFEACAAEVSFPPNMLHWSNTKPGWYCENCAFEGDVNGGDIETSDWSLADELAFRRIQQACCDGGGGGCASPDCWWKRMRRRRREVVSEGGA